MRIYSLKNVYRNIVDRFTHFKEGVYASFKIGISTKVQAAHAQTAFMIDRPHPVDSTVYPTHATAMPWPMQRLNFAQVNF